MHGPFMFGLTRREATTRQAQRLRAIAARHEADFVGPVRLPGNELRGWFEAPNRGAPFDDATRDAVMADVAADASVADLFEADT